MTPSTSTCWSRTSAGGVDGRPSRSATKTPYDWSDDPSYDATSLIGTVTVPPVSVPRDHHTVNVPWTVTGVAPETCRSTSA
ncbi:MAG: hypothetical protein U0166_05775 [Acidobacteriota bacterium]